MSIGYFPGCSLHATAREFDESLRAISQPLGMELKELDDWSCCGATSGHATNHLLSVSLPARSLALAEEQGHQSLLAPCAACYSRLATAHHELGQDEALAQKVRGILERPEFTNSTEVLNIVQALADVQPALKQKLARPLKGLKVACYYGCLLLRPHAVTGFDDAEVPSSMETLVAACGATPVKWNKGLDCCGGGFSLSRTSSVIRLGREILEDAILAGADAMVVACPMCHSNLDLRQKAMARRGQKLELPILFLTQLVGLALGIEAKTLGLDRHFVPTRGLVQQLPPAGRSLEGGASPKALPPANAQEA